MLTVPRAANRFGWAIGEKTERWFQEGRRYEPRGTHGCDRDHEDMHGIFIAHGPYAQRIKASQNRKMSMLFDLPPSDMITVLPGFDNLELYNLVTKEMLELTNVAPNNGTTGFWQSLLE